MAEKKVSRDVLIGLLGTYREAAEKETRDDAFAQIWESIKDYAASIMKSTYPTYFLNNAEEMLQTAAIAVYECLDNYNPEKGALTTWVKTPIIHACNEYISSCIHHTTTYYGSAISKIQKCANALKAQGLEPSDYNISDRTGISVYTIGKCQEILAMSQEGHLDSLEFIDSVLEGSSESPEETAVRKEEVAAIHKYLNRLPEDQHQALLYRYWYDQSYTKISDKMGLPKETVRRLVNSATNTLREGMKREKLFESRQIKREVDNLKIEISLLPIDDQATAANNELLLESISIDF